jgi:hypothetical protein
VLKLPRYYGILQAFDFTSLNKVLRYVNINKGLVIYIKKYLKAKKKNYENFKYFTMQKYNLQKNPLKETKNPSRYHNSIISLKFQHKPKHHLSKILI